MSKKMNWINLTIVGEFWAVVMISSVYGIGIISFQLANQPGGMLILPVVTLLWIYFWLRESQSLLEYRLRDF